MSRTVIRSLTIVSAIGLAFASSASGQSADGAAVYKATCAQCHDDPTGRTPSREALKDRTADAVLTSLTTGSMAFNSLALSMAEKRAVAEYVSGKTLGASSTTAGACTSQKPLTANAGWNGWGSDTSNTRYQPKPGLMAADVPNLKLKWAFGFPGGAQAYGNPAIVGGRVFVGSDNGKLYSLDADTGCTYWSVQADGGIRAAPSIGTSGSRTVVYFGDLKGNVFAIDALTGETIWKKQVDDHKYARITGAPKLYDGRLYVPVSSVEEAPAAQPSYECCTFRGSVVALNGAASSTLRPAMRTPNLQRRRPIR